MEVGRLNGVIRALEESTSGGVFEKDERSRVVTHVMHRVVEIFDAIDALGEAQAGSPEPRGGA